MQTRRIIPIYAIGIQFASNYGDYLDFGRNYAKNYASIIRQGLNGTGVLFHVKSCPIKYNGLILSCYKFFVGLSLQVSKTSVVYMYVLYASICVG